MSLLLSNEILLAITKELKNAKKSVQIITAYCKESSIIYLDQYIQDDVFDKKIMLRFRLDDLVKGSTDFAVLDYCRKNEWKVYLRFDIHAKTYIIDNKRGLVGSANATNMGLSLGASGNMEMGTLVDVEEQDVKKINGLYRDAIFVTDELYDKLKSQYDSIKKTKVGKALSWDLEILNMFKPRVESLFSHELPVESDFVTGQYIEFLDTVLLDNVDDMRNVFRWSSAYLWLLNTLEENDGCLYFGTLTEKLHNSLVTDPKPYRRDVKVMLANLLDLIERWQMPEVIIDRPNYSQRIRLVKD